MNARSDAGVTLVEMLVAMTLLAMLATLIASGVQIGARAWGAAERQTSEIDDLETVQTLLRRTIEAARPALASTDPAARRIAFSGEPGQLTLVVPQPGTNGAGPWTQERFFVARRGAMSALFMNWRPDTPVAVAAPEQQELLLDGVAGLSLAYFGPPTPGEPAVWSDRWTDRNRLPNLVRISIERAGRYRAWPDLVVATRATANPGCINDLAGAACDIVGP